MRKWIAVAAGLATGLLAGIWYGQQPANSVPWFADAIWLVSLVIARTVGTVFHAGSEWSGIEFAYPAFLVVWSALGAFLGFITSWILKKRTTQHDST
jgi:hypothetical protein